MGVSAKVKMFVLAAGLLAGMLAWSGRALAEYAVGPGDVLEISIYGAPDLKRRVSVGPDGDIAFPLLGTVPVSGLSRSAVQSRMTDLLRERKIVSSPEVTVEIVQYRPFYISGEVAKPGSYPYQPDLTVRQAVALAGGFDIGRQNTGASPLNEQADLYNESFALRVDLMREIAKERRIRAELEQKDTIDFSGLSDMLLPPAFAEAIFQVERDHLASNLDRARNVRRFSGDAVEQSTAQLEALQKQLLEEETGLKQQNQDLDKVVEMNQKGLAPLSRVLEEQRSILLTKSRYFATIAQLSGTKRTVVEINQQRSALESARRSELLRDLSECLATIEKIRERNRAVTLKLSNVRFKTALRPGSGLTRVKYVIRRAGPDSPAPIDVDENAPVKPGDDIEVSLDPTSFVAAGETAPAN